MKKAVTILTLVLGLMLTSVTWSAGWEETLKGYGCIEVEPLNVQEAQEGKKKEKIDPLAPEMISNIQNMLVKKIAEAKLVTNVAIIGQSSCPGKTLLVGGTILSYDQGNTATAIFLPMGGDAKMTVEAYAKDKETGQTLAQKKLSRRDTGERGSENEGIQREISSEITKFVKKGK